MVSTHRPRTVSAVELVQMPQQSEVRDRADDWTGLTDALERRKLQNRLNQRIHRRRRRAPNGTKLHTSSNLDTAVVVPRPPPQSCERFRGLLVAIGDGVNDDQRRGESASTEGADSRSILHPGLQTGAEVNRRDVPGSDRCCVRRPQIEKLLVRFEEMARRDYYSGSPRVDQVLTLIQFNVIRALISNTLNLGWNLDWLECTEPLSPWTTTNDTPDSTGNKQRLPHALRPTPLQQTVEHHPWIDLWPIPKMRDNLLLARNSYDEDRLCNDLVEFADVPNEQTGLIVWSEPWDLTGWEVSETFLRNWGWTLKGCGELLQSTNYWRTRRGEKPLEFEI